MNKNIKILDDVGIKISTTQENLAHGLSVVSRVSGKNINLPILQNVLVKAHDGQIRLSTTNLEIAINCTVRGKVDQGGEFTVPARLFSEYIGLLPSQNIDLNVQGTKLTVKSGKFETELHGIPATEFPVIPEVSGGATFTVPVEDFRKAIGSVIFATAQHESRPELSGVFFGFNQSSNGVGTLTLAATDSYRLGETVLSLAESNPEDQLSVIVPARTVAELGRIIGIGHDEMSVPKAITIVVTENQIQFTTGAVELVSRLVMGQYPDYRQIVPTQFKTEALLPREEFMKAVKAASLFSKPGLYDVRLEFGPGRPLAIHAADAGTGEYHTEIEGAVTGSENHVVVNYKYLLDGLGAMNDDEVNFKMIDGSNPCLVTPKNKEEKYLYIVMPIKQ